VFDYLSPKDRERLRNLASGSITTQPGPATEGEPPQPSSVEESIPRIDASIAKSALHGFQPFQSDPGKAARYTAYLKSQANPDEFPESDLRPAPGQPREAFYHELREFANSATIFKPTGGVLGGRFATAKVVERLDSGKEGLYVPASGDDYMTEEERQAVNIAKEKEEKREEDPKVNAAKMGMFGPLTRSVVEWDPAKLLCKRFGVREPVREIAIEQSASSMGNGPDEWKAQMPSQTQTFVSASSDERGGGGGVGGQGENESIMQAASASFRTGSSRVKGDLSNVGLGEDDDQGRDTLTYVKPERDIFKAIFESDEEDADEDEEQDIGGYGSPGAVPGPSGSVATATATTVAVAVAPTQDGQVQEVSQKTTTDEPAYLGTGKPTTATYVPASETAKGPVDMSTFRPTFNVQPKSKDTEAKKEKKEKKSKDKDRRKGKAILSFEDEGEGLTLPEKPKRRKSKKEKEKTKVKSMADGGENEEDMWVEKPPAEAVGGLGGSDAMQVDVKDNPPGAEVKQGGRRMRAVDFL
jgi:G patch domain-containing protein 1